MAKNLDNSADKKKNPIFDEPEESPDILDGEEEDVNFPLDFDDEGAVFSDDEEDEEEPDEDQEEDEEEDSEEEEIDESAQEEEQEEKPVVKTKQKSPAESKIVNLKKENQRLAKEKADLQKQLQDKQSASKLETLKTSYVEQGYDAETAAKYAKDDLRISQIEARQAALDFREQNEEVFARYPLAKANAQDIMQKATASGMTAEQICRGLYGKPELPAHEQRAREAAKGNSTRTVKDTPDTASASRNSGSLNRNDVLSPAEVKEKRALERMFNKGAELTVAEYKKYTSRKEV